MGVGEAQEMVDAQLGSAAYPLEGKPYCIKRKESSEGTWILSTSGNFRVNMGFESPAGGNMKPTRYTKRIVWRLKARMISVLLSIVVRIRLVGLGVG